MRWIAAFVALALVGLLLSGCAPPEFGGALASADRPSGVPVERAAEPVLEPAGLRAEDGAPIVVVVETRDRSISVTAELVRDPSRTDLHELRAPRVMADIDEDFLLQPAVSP